jgi:ssDNA-binding replication factor A large subunit
MSRKKKIITEDDGTPVEVEDDAPETVSEAVETEAEANPHNAAVEGSRSVRWTKQGAERGAFSEHGQHAEGDIVVTAHADAMIAMGFAEEASE